MILVIWKGNHHHCTLVLMQHILLHLVSYRFFILLWMLNKFHTISSLQVCALVQCKLILVFLNIYFSLHTVGFILYFPNDANKKRMFLLPSYFIHWKCHDLFCTREIYNLSEHWQCHRLYQACILFLTTNKYTLLYFLQPGLVRKVKYIIHIWKFGFKEV